MRVLLVEPEFRRYSRGRKQRLLDASSDEGVRAASRDDETLWYPPLGLMKLARFHKDRGDQVHFVSGCDRSLTRPDLFTSPTPWDRVYIATLFTYDFRAVAATIDFYRSAVGGTVSRMFVGGILASLLPDDLYEETGIYPVVGVLNSPAQIGLEGSCDIDALPPDYSIVDPRLYAINDTYYAYTSRGCVNHCAWCGVPRVEPDFIPYIDLKPTIQALRADYGDKAKLKLMDNNVLASPELPHIVDDLLELGYGRGQYTQTSPRRERIVDFNQGLDASFFTAERVELLSRVNIRPLRVAFDRVSERDVYLRAIQLAREHGFTEFSNYMLYNFHDSPRDLYERLMVNVELNQRWLGEEGNGRAVTIYSYPMRYAPIDRGKGSDPLTQRDRVSGVPAEQRDWLSAPVWTKRFTRSIEIMKGAGNGAIPPGPSLARRAIGATFEEFMANLYMPEELLRNRNKHERRVYADEPARPPGTGLVEEFREFMLRMLREQGPAFRTFHATVADGSLQALRRGIAACDDQEVRKWLELYKRR
jgi:hypothetical protein